MLSQSGTPMTANKNKPSLQVSPMPTMGTTHTSPKANKKSKSPRKPSIPNIEPSHETKNLTHLYVLPVLFLEFMALALTRAVLPAMLLQSFQDNVYFIMGCVEFVRGLLAFVMCPLFGKISDVVGRRSCLFITVLGTCAPVCSLAFMPYTYSYTFGGNGNTVTDTDDYYSVSSVDATNSMNAGNAATITDGNEDWMVMNPASSSSHHHHHHHSIDRIWIFVTLLAISGMFSSTFPLTFAYISDTVTVKEDRVAAYGLALATFGLSFTIGPMAGGYLARVDKGSIDSSSDEYEDSNNIHRALSGSMNNMIPVADPIGQQRVFLSALVLTVLDLLYIYFILPESISSSKNKNKKNNNNDDKNDDEEDNQSYKFASKIKNFKNDILPQSWSPWDALKVFSGDPVLAEVGKIAFLYYSSLWAVVSTLMLYAAKRFHLSPERLGELMSALGLSTMIAEAVLVRVIVPVLGEKQSMRLGLMAFTLQCALLGVANRSYQLFICVAISTLANLVYPSLSSLVSNAVAPDKVGEALGAINGIKALTEGFGPLFFGTLMTMSEGTALPGAPYLIAAIFALLAYRQTDSLPDEDDEDYVSERYDWNAHTDRIRKHYLLSILDRWGLMGRGAGGRSGSGRNYDTRDEARSIMMKGMDGSDSDEELCGLLSEIEEDSSVTTD